MDDVTTTTLQSFKCSHIIVYSTSPLIRPSILQRKSVFSWGRQFGSIYLSVYEIWPDKRGGLWWEWPYNMGTTTGFNEMIEKDIISHKELKLELCSIVGPVEIHLTLPQFCACLKPEPRNPLSYVFVFFVFNTLRWEIVVCFVDIGKIVDHHCLNFLFIIYRIPLVTQCIPSWVSEWLLFYAISAIFQLYHGKNKLIFNEMMMRSPLYYPNMLSWIFIVLAHWKISPRIDMSPHSADSEPTSLCSFSFMLDA